MVCGFAGLEGFLQPQARGKLMTSKLDPRENTYSGGESGGGKPSKPANPHLGLRCRPPLGGRGDRGDRGHLLAALPRGGTRLLSGSRVVTRPHGGCRATRKGGNISSISSISSRRRGRIGRVDDPAGHAVPGSGRDPRLRARVGGRRGHRRSDGRGRIGQNCRLSWGNAGFCPSCPRVTVNLKLLT